MSTNKPTLLAYTVKNRGKGQKAIWTLAAQQRRYVRTNGSASRH